MSVLPSSGGVSVVQEYTLVTNNPPNPLTAPILGPSKPGNLLVAVIAQNLGVAPAPAGWDLWKSAGNISIYQRRATGTAEDAFPIETSGSGSTLFGWLAELSGSSLTAEAGPDLTAFASSSGGSIPQIELRAPSIVVVAFDGTVNAYGPVWPKQEGGVVTGRDAGLFVSPLISPTGHPQAFGFVFGSSGPPTTTAVFAIS
jgi:hypothetical protein